MRRRSWVWLAGSAAFLVIVLAPYLVAWRAQPSGFHFSGFLVNPIDGFSYLAKMRQGAEGSWLFRLAYAPEPGPGAFLFLYYLLLGHVQRLVGASPLLVYHAARLVGAAAMLAAAFLFYRVNLGPGSARRWAMALTAFGAGLGWIGVALGRSAIDLWVPEAVPFFAALANAHFPLSAAAMLTALSALTAPTSPRLLRFGGAAAAGMMLGVVQPFAVIPVVVVGGLWLTWMNLRPPVDAPSAGGQRDQRVAGVVFLAASAPIIVYDVWVTRSHAALAAWAAQNLTPTPPVLDVVLGFGLVLVLAIAALVTERAADRGGGRILITWLVAGLLLAFVPFGLQRRMLLGVFFPMAALAGMTLARLAGAAGARSWLAYILFMLCLPSNLVLLTATIGGALTQQPEVVMRDSERTAYAWAANHLPSGALILAGDVSGNRLPAYADVRVVYGHPFETPMADESLRWVESIYGGRFSADESLAQLRDRSVDYVFVGPRERAMGALDWLMGLNRVYQIGDVAIYRVPGS
jgi:hypothetical protein